MEIGISQGYMLGASILCEDFLILTEDLRLEWFDFPDTSLGQKSHFLFIIYFWIIMYFSDLISVLNWKLDSINLKVKNKEIEIWDL